MHLSYTLTPRARVSAGRGAEVQDTRPIHHVLPGTTVRGALGAAWWSDPASAFEPGATQPARQDAFDQLFAQLVVREAKPKGARLRALSQLTVKYAGSGRRVTGQHDLAAGAVAQCPVCAAPFGATLGWTSLDGSTAPLDRCAACESVFEMERGGWAFDGPIATVTRTALDSNGVAETGKLFTRPAVEKSVGFEGELQIRDKDAVPPEALDWLMRQMLLSVGGQRSTLGRVRWHAAPVAAPSLPSADLVVMQLHSPAILVDGRGLATLDLEAYLQAIPGSGGLACRPWVRSTQVSTWHGMAGIPKPVEWALEVGTTAVLQGWSADALRVLARGIGVRQLEGFGHVVLRSPAGLARFTEPAQSDELTDASHVSALLALTAGRGQRNTVNGLLTAARHIAGERGGGLDADGLAAIVKDVLGLPWARDLGPDSRDEVERLLRSEELTTIITQLTSWKARS